MRKKYILAIDLGGTNFRLALLNLDCRILDKIRCPTSSFNNKEELIKGIVDLVAEMLQRHKLNIREVLGLGLGVPGPVDEKKGVVYFLPNVPGWKKVRLKDILEKKIKLPVFLDNDANLMGLGEYEFGAGKNSSCLVCVTVGTGVGGVIIAHGQIFRGKSNLTGEIGHLPLNEKGSVCNCGGIACLETYVGNKRLLAKAKKIYRRDISLEEVANLARKKDKKAQSFWKEIGEKIGLALTGVINLLNPDRLVIGGGIANAGKVLLDHIKSTVKKRAMPDQVRDCKIIPSRLKYNAGLIGAAVMVLRNSRYKKRSFASSMIILAFLFSLLLKFRVELILAQENKEEPLSRVNATVNNKYEIFPLEINGDKVEYIPESKEFVAEGNVTVVSQRVKLYCDKLILNSESKYCTAQGNVVLEEARGRIKAEKIFYNFASQSGWLEQGNFQVDSYFGFAEKLEKEGQEKLIAHYGYITTCSLDKPHFLMKANQVKLRTNDQLYTEDLTAFVGTVPILYIPQLNQKLNDPLMHVQLSPGKRSDWGSYLLTGWRYRVNQNLVSRLNLDYRDKLGFAQGMGLNYSNNPLGNGDFKFYYTKENAKDIPSGSRNDFRRYLLRLRHRWDITTGTNLMAEFYRIYDTKRALLGNEYNFLKDYFYRDYEKDSQPATYISLHHNFSHAMFDALVIPRVNDWYSAMTEYLPKVAYAIPSLKLGQTPFYFKHNFEFSSLKYSHPAQNAFVSVPTKDYRLNSIDLSNKFSLPLKAAFLNLTPFFRVQNSFYDEDVNNKSMWNSPRTVFSSGIDLSTRFWRDYNFKTNFLKFDLNGLRHVFSPKINYVYQHKPTLANSRLKSVLAQPIYTDNVLSFELSNKLQTRRKDSMTTLVDLWISSAYNFKTGDNNKRAGQLSDFLVKLDLQPYAWLRIYTESEYDSRNKNFSSVNPDLSLRLGPQRSLTIGQRYLRKTSNEIVYSLDYRFNPKWKMNIFQRHEIGSGATLKKGLKEQEYTLSRDLHCWTMELSYNREKNRGETIWLILRLKAFPGLEFNFNQSYNAPRPGGQNN